MPATYDCRAFGFENGQSGLFYNFGTHTLLKGVIRDYLLNAEVVECHFHTFSVGYIYDDWDLCEIIYIPITLSEYLAWLNDPRTDYKKIKAYFKAKPLVEKFINR